MATWTYETSPVAWAYKQDRSFASFIIGPVGSGKSVPSVQRILDIGSEQELSPDGKRRSRFAVVRNTMPELRSTTAVTYQQIYPADPFGEIIWRSPATHMIHPAGTDLEIEVNLIALDKPKDVKKLLSLELTGAFINEFREVPRSVVTRMTERVGRYNINERPNTWSGLWGDTNPPDSDHWIYKWHKEETPHGYSFHQQPPGVLEVKPLRGGAEIIDENFPEYQGIKLSSAEVLIYFRGSMQRVDCPIEIIPSAGRNWIVNPWMENLAALSKVDHKSNPLGSGSYYGRALAGKTLEEVQSYLQGVYTFVMDGRRVVPQYNDSVHAISNLPIMQDQEIVVGMDIGGGTLQPSAIYFQRHPRGNYLVQLETVCYDLGVARFGTLVMEDIQKHFPGHLEKNMIGTFWGDPAGEKRDEIFETKSFDYLRNTHGWKVRAAPSQDPKMRIAAIAGPCERMIDGKPGIMFAKERTPILRKGLMGGWYYKRVQASGDDRYADKPSKTPESHPCDGCGYGLLGMGEFAALGGMDKVDGPPAQADGDFDMFN